MSPGSSRSESPLVHAVPLLKPPHYIDGGLTHSAPYPPLTPEEAEASTILVFVCFHICRQQDYVGPSSSEATTVSHFFIFTHHYIVLCCIMLLNGDHIDCNCCLHSMLRVNVYTYQSTRYKVLDTTQLIPMRVQHYVVFITLNGPKQMHKRAYKITHKRDAVIYFRSTELLRNLYINTNNTNTHSHTHELYR